MMKSLTLDPDKHQHNFTEISLMRILRVHKSYTGAAGDRAMLTRLCNGDECDAYEAFEYGEYKKIKEKYKELTGKAWRVTNGGANTISITETDNE